MTVDIIPAENQILWFSNGTSAKVMGGGSWGKNTFGEPITRFVLRPTEVFMNLNDVRRDELENGIDLVLEIPTKSIIELNPHSPSNRVSFVMTDYRKRHTDFTKFFYCHNCGTDYPNVFDSLRSAESTIKSKDIQIAQLKEEIKKLSEKLELELAETSLQRIVDDLYAKLSKLLVGGKSQSEY